MAGSVLGDQHTALDPCLEVARRAHVDVVHGVVLGQRAPANDADQILRAQAVVTRLHLGRNLVIRLRYHRAKVGDLS